MPKGISPSLIYDIVREQLTSRMHVFFGEFCLLVLLLSSFLGFANVRASADQDQQQVPAPQIQTFTNETGYPGGAYNLIVQQGAGLQTMWGVRRSSDPNNGLNVMWQGNILYNVSGSLYDFQYVLLSCAHLSYYSFPAGAYSVLGVYFNCSGELIPVCLCNCSSFDMVTSNVTYVGNVPTFTNTVTFYDIPLETFDLSNSSVTIVFTQHFNANWTLLTVKTDVYADLTDLKLYTSNRSEVSANTRFSLDFNYLVGLGEQTSENATSWTPILASEITPTSIRFNINSTRGNFSNADMSLGETYDEFQGDTTIPDKNATAHFVKIITTEKQTMYNCIQTFSGLTYGLTTGVRSDPTIHVQHARVLVPADSGIILVIVGIATVAVLLIAVPVVYTRKKRALISARADKTQKQAENMRATIVRFYYNFAPQT